jgi:hypothetical protein
MCTPLKLLILCTDASQSCSFIGGSANFSAHASVWLAGALLGESISFVFRLFCSRIFIGGSTHIAGSTRFFDIGRLITRSSEVTKLDIMCTVFAPISVHAVLNVAAVIIIKTVWGLNGIRT